jgi:hypothetical protein
MERSRKTTARVTKSRLDLPEYFTSPFAISMYLCLAKTPSGREIE